jgi:hypothetical protein
MMPGLVGDHDPPPETADACVALLVVEVGLAFLRGAQFYGETPLDVTVNAPPEDDRLAEPNAEEPRRDEPLRDGTGAKNQLF